MLLLLLEEWVKKEDWNAEAMIVQTSRKSELNSFCMNLFNVVARVQLIPLYGNRSLIYHIFVFKQKRPHSDVWYYADDVLSHRTRQTK